MKRKKNIIVYNSANVWEFSLFTASPSQDFINELTILCVIMYYNEFHLVVGQDKLAQCNLNKMMFGW